jgi:hypothetical protein
MEKRYRLAEPHTLHEFIAASYRLEETFRVQNSLSEKEEKPPTSVECRLPIRAHIEEKTAASARFAIKFVPIYQIAQDVSENWER